MILASIAVVIEYEIIVSTTIGIVLDIKTSLLCAGIINIAKPITNGQVIIQLFLYVSFVSFEKVYEIIKWSHTIVFNISPLHKNKNTVLKSEIIGISIISIKNNTG